MSFEDSFLDRWLGLAAAGAVVALAACVPSQVRTTGLQNPSGVQISTIPPVEVAEADLRTGAFASLSEIKVVYFEFNKADLTPAARAILQSNARYLKEHSGLDARVAGSCDERGTVEYNLALGQRRAKVVRDYYILLGVDGSRIATISYGKEDPVCSEHAEECWAKNRRAQTDVRSTAEPATTAAPAAAPTPASAAASPAPVSTPDSSGQ